MSEQFLNGMSPQYGLDGAIQIKSQKQIEYVN